MGRHHNKHNDYGEKWIITIALKEKPLTIEEIEEHYAVIGRRLGIFNINSVIKKSETAEFKAYLKDSLDSLISLEWVVLNNHSYSLTEKGLEEANKAYAEGMRAIKVLDSILKPRTVSIVTFFTHLFLVALKLPAAILSGSVGLLSDSLDTLADSISSLLVYIGIKKNKENLANIFLVVLMVCTAVVTLGKSISSIANPTLPTIDTYTFIAAIGSMIFCSVLYVYQKYVGIRTKSPALLTQSVDSKNHILASISVMAGLIAVFLNFVWLDIIVGLAVASLITYSAVELIIELIRNNNDEDSKRTHQFFLYNTYRKNQYKLYVLDTVKNNSFSDMILLESFLKSKLDAEDNVTLMALTKSFLPEVALLISNTIETLQKEEYIKISSNEILITDKGIKFIEDNQDLTLSKMGNVSKILWSVFFSTIEFILSFMLLFYLSSLLNARLLWTNTETIFMVFNVPINLGGLISFIIGYLLYVYARYHFKKISRYHRHRTKNELFTSGYYKKVRHPMYGMMAMMQISLLTALNFQWTAILSVFVMMLMYGNAWFEEKSLLKQFNQTYKDYMINTNRILSTQLMMLIILVLISNCLGFVLGL